jgi:hypothetical protein
MVEQHHMEEELFLGKIQRKLTDQQLTPQDILQKMLLLQKLLTNV